MDFGTLLKRERIRAGLSQQALATKCSVSAVYIYRLEKGGIDPPSRAMCGDVANALDVDSNLLWQAAFESRFRRWAEREGYPVISKRTTMKLFELLERDSSSKADRRKLAVPPPHQNRKPRH